MRGWGFQNAKTGGCWSAQAASQPTQGKAGAARKEAQAGTLWPENPLIGVDGEAGHMQTHGLCN